MKRFEESMKYFKDVVNTVFTEEPNEDDVISIKELFEAHSKATGQDPDNIDYRLEFRGVMWRIVDGMHIRPTRWFTDSGDLTYSKKQLWDVANAVYYWEKPGYIG